MSFSCPLGICPAHMMQIVRYMRGCESKIRLGYADPCEYDVIASALREAISCFHAILWLKVRFAVVGKGTRKVRVAKT